MTQTPIQKSFAPFKRYLPRWISNPLRSVGTAILGPARAAYRSGYFRSAFQMASVTRDGKPLPWYTYAAIDFLKYRNYADRSVLEFGGGHSTHWWAGKARQVVTLEGDMQWYLKMKETIPANVDLCHVSMDSRESNVAAVQQALAARPQREYDVIVIDGLYRSEMIPIARGLLSKDGIIICDNAEGYGFYEGFKDSGLWRVDFLGTAPGVVLPHATSVYFNPASCFVFDARYPIPVMALEK